MMRLAIIVLALMIAPCHAQTQTMWTFDDTDAHELMRTECAARNADAGAIGQSLAARGWRQLSDAERQRRDPDNLAGGFTMHWSALQAWAPADNATLMLMVGAGPVAGGEVQASFCLVVESVPFARQTRDVRRWLGFSRFQMWGPGGDLFVYVRDEQGNFRDGARLSEAEQQAEANAGRLGFVQVIGDDARSVVNFSVMRPTAPRP